MSSKHRIGIFICRCGANIAERLHFDNLKEQIAKLPDVVGVFEDNFFCAPVGKNKIKDDSSCRRRCGAEPRNHT